MEREDKGGKKAAKARRREENAAQQVWREPLNAALALGRKGDWSAAYDWIEPYRNLDGWRQFGLHVNRYAVKRAEAATGKPWSRGRLNPAAQQAHAFRTAAIEYALLEIGSAGGSFPVVEVDFEFEIDPTSIVALIGVQTVFSLWFLVLWWQGHASGFEKFLAVASLLALLSWVFQFIKAPAPAPDWSLPP
jgi:hypothetical protein